jgi:hypothetical protein
MVFWGSINSSVGFLGVERIGVVCFRYKKIICIRNVCKAPNPAGTEAIYITTSVNV